MLHFFASQPRKLFVLKVIHVIYLILKMNKINSVEIPCCQAQGYYPSDTFTCGNNDITIQPHQCLTQPCCHASGAQLLYYKDGIAYFGYSINKTNHCSLFLTK